MGGGYAAGTRCSKRKSISYSTFFSTTFTTNGEDDDNDDGGSTMTALSTSKCLVIFLSSPISIWARFHYWHDAKLALSCSGKHISRIMGPSAIPTTHETSPIILACVIFASHGEDDPPIVEGSHLTTIITKSRYRFDLSFSDIPSRRSSQISSHTRENMCITRSVFAEVPGF
ncbi:hypothetical protein ARMGADRAFT_1091654 [Armillaria gallica]|uniref:Uncharacterized protein n=1 Tax=Armillaria gallica TaxID=47427 RepID=A0A2H3CGY0_ARMGA|nr:hypothetical protein ARMGADRAFT_1091654 [Armillaria gallica]